MVVVNAAMSSLRRKADIQGLKGVEAAAHLPAKTADTSSQGNSSKIRPAHVRQETHFPCGDGLQDGHFCQCGLQLLAACNQWEGGRRSMCPFLWGDTSSKALAR